MILQKKSAFRFRKVFTGFFKIEFSHNNQIIQKVLYFFSTNYFVEFEKKFSTNYLKKKRTYQKLELPISSKQKQLYGVIVYV